MYYIIHEISQGLNGIGLFLKQSIRTVAQYHLIRMVASAIEYRTHWLSVTSYSVRFM